jgi:NADH-quinone oxidoreductase subunit E
MESIDLKAQTLEAIEQLIPRYPEKRSLVLPLLHLIQEDRGYICDRSMEWVAGKLGLTPMAILEVVTFYPMFRRHPIGKLHIKVCRTLPCALRGAYSVCEQLQQRLNCKLGGTSPDGLYTIEFVECIANCGTGPVVQVDEAMHEGIDPANLDPFVATLRELASKKANS